MKKELTIRAQDLIDEKELDQHYVLALLHPLYHYSSLLRPLVNLRKETLEHRSLQSIPTRFRNRLDERVDLLVRRRFVFLE